MTDTTMYAGLREGRVRIQYIGNRCQTQYKLIQRYRRNGSFIGEA